MPRRRHSARVIALPIAGVYCTVIDSDHHFGRHWHDSYGFGVIDRGAQVWRSGRGHVRGYPGEIISTNPGEVHDGRPIGDAARRWRIVHVDVAAMNDLTANRAGPVEISLPVIQDPALLRALQQLFARAERWPDPGVAREGLEALACEEALVTSCSQLMARHGSRRAMRPVAPANLRRVRERLADDGPVPPSLADLAAPIGLSRFQLLRQFEKAFGLPPHRWLLRRRVERARALIAAGRALADAAAESGFVDQSHMTRTFVRHHGFTPGAWRKATRLQ
jgi:AraC-like DNA-binding protein